MRDFLRVYDTIGEPLITIDQLSVGAAHPSQVEALNTVYPKLMDALRQRVKKQIVENEGVPMSRRLAVSQILGLDFNATRQQAPMAQAVYAQQGAASQPKAQMPVSRTKGLNSSGRAAQETTAWREAQSGIGQWNKANR
jgi:hypothetical protein